MHTTCNILHIGPASHVSLPASKLQFDRTLSISMTGDCLSLVPHHRLSCTPHIQALPSPIGGFPIFLPLTGPKRPVLHFVCNWTKACFLTAENVAGIASLYSVVRSHRSDLRVARWQFRGRACNSRDRPGNMTRPRDGQRPHLQRTSIITLRFDHVSSEFSKCSSDWYVESCSPRCQLLVHL